MEQVVVITGGGQGIGREIALGLSEKGNFSIVIDKNEKKARETEYLIKSAGFLCGSYSADLCDPKAVSLVFKEILERAGRVDALVNNAGYYLPMDLEKTTVDLWHLTIDSNLTTTFLCSLEVFRYMKHAKRGKIINVTSGLVTKSATGLAPYIAAKAGVIGLTRALAMDMGAFNITVNAIAPGLIKTEYACEVFSAERFDRSREGRAIKRDALPRDLLGSILFLISAASDFITGQTLSIDGGGAFF